MNGLASVFVFTSVLLVATISYTIWLFVDYSPVYRNNMATNNNRAKRNEAPPNALNGWHNITLYGGPDWDNLTLADDYYTYGITSCMGNGPPANRISGIDLGDDSTCTADIVDTIAAAVKYRGRSRPPVKPVFKMKLYRCENDDGDLQWKKFKNVGCTGYTKGNTNKFTLRSDRSDFLGGIYDLFGSQLFTYLGGRDDMWGNSSLVKINSEWMGMYLWTTSPDDKLLPGFDDERDMFFKWDWGEAHPTGTDADLKTPDSEEWCSYNNVSGCTNGTNELAAFLEIHDGLLAGTVQFDTTTMAAFIWTMVMTNNQDPVRSRYFYTINNVLNAGPAWDSGFAYNCPALRCEFTRSTRTSGWNENTFNLTNPFLANATFVTAVIETWQNKSVTEFVANFTQEIRDRYAPLIRYDWSLWENAQHFECVPAVFILGNYRRDYGGYLKWTLESIDTQIDLFLDHINDRSHWIDANYNDIGTRKQKKYQRPWGPLFIALTCLWTVTIAVFVVVVFWWIQKREAVDISSYFFGRRSAGATYSTVSSAAFM